MEILVITVITIVLTFLFGLAFGKIFEKKPVMVRKHKLHHSIIGILIFAAGIILKNTILLSIGLGIYLSHGFEEMYFNKTRVPEAFFVFVTRAKRPRRR